MAEQVLGHLEGVLEQALFEPMRTTASPRRKLNAMLDALDRFYDGGKQACLLERLSSSIESKSFRRPLAKAFATWIDAVEALGREAGLSKAAARARAEELVVRIEGALIVSAGTGDPKVFGRTIEDLRRAW